MLLIFATIAATVFARAKRAGSCPKEFRSRGSLFSGTTGATQRGLCHGGARVRGGSCSGSGVRGSPYESWPGISTRGFVRPIAMTEFRRALKIKPGLAGANFFLGVDYCKLGEGANAITYLKAALKAEPGRPDTWLWLATAQEIAGQWQAEVGTLQRALALRPADVDLLISWGVLMSGWGNRRWHTSKRLLLVLRGVSSFWRKAMHRATSGLRP